MAEKFMHTSLFLKKARLISGLSRAEVAEKLNIHPQYVSNWENSKCAPPSDKIYELMKVLKIQRSDLVTAMVDDAREVIEQKVARPRRRTGTGL